MSENTIFATQKLIEIVENIPKVHNAGFQKGRVSVVNPFAEEREAEGNHTLNYWGKNFSELEINSHNTDEGKFLFLKLLKPEDTKNEIHFGHMFDGCATITYIPEIDTSNGENFRYMFCGCENLIDAPNIDISNGKVFRHMFCGCKALQNIPLYDTSNGEDFLGMFYGCHTTVTIPLINTSRGTNFQQFLDGCWRLKSSIIFDTYNGTNFYAFARNCQQATIINIDITNATNTEMAFINCKNLVNVNLGDSIPISINFANSPLIEIENAENLIRSLRDYSNDSKNKYKHTITLHPDVWAQLDTKYENDPFGSVPTDDTGHEFRMISLDEYIAHIGWLRA